MSPSPSPSPLPSTPMTLNRVLASWEAIVVRWGLNDDECSSLLGGLPAGRGHGLAPFDHAAAEDRMRLVVELEPTLAWAFPDDGHTRGWLRRPNMHLGQRTPLEMMAESPEWTRWLIDAVRMPA
jgi:hypothetical protein